MRKIIKLIGYAAVTFVLLIGLLVVLVNFVFKDEIIAKAIATLNKELKSPVSIEQTDISVLQHFPEVTVDFTQLLLENKGNEDASPLANLSEVSVGFDLLKVLFGTYEISTIYLKDGVVDLQTYQDGFKNYDVFRESNDSTGSTGSIAFEHISLERVWIEYFDEKNNFQYRSYINNGDLQASLDNDIWTLHLSANTDSVHITNVPNQLATFPIDLQAECTYDQSIDHFELLNGTIGIEEVTGSVNGSSSPNNHDYSLSIAEADIESLSWLFNQNFALDKELDYEGQITLDTRYTSNATDEHFSGEGTLTSLQLSHKDVNAEIAVASVPFNFNIDLESATNSTFDAELIGLQSADNMINGNLGIANFKAPHLTAQFDGDFDLYSLNLLFQNSFVKDLHGQLALNDFNLSGSLENPAIEAFRFSGIAHLQNIELHIRNTLVDGVNGELNFDNNQVVAKAFSFGFHDSDFTFDGTIEQLIPYIKGLVFDNNNTRLIANGRVQSNQLHLSSIISGFGEGGQEESNSDAAPIAYSRIFNWYGRIDLDIDSIVYEKAVFENVTASASLRPSSMDLSRLAASFKSGSADGIAIIKFMDPNDIQVETTLDVQQLGITEFFYAFDNFGQQTLTDQHIQGQLNTNATAKMVWNGSDFDTDKFYCLADVEILDGRLQQFEPMAELGRFINLNELMDIEFKKLSNTIEIKNGVVQLPNTEIESSVMNIWLSGTHNFENYVDYRFQLNLKSVLAKTMNKGKFSQGFEKLPTGGLNLYLRMHGHVDDLNVGYDTKGVKEKIAQDLKDEKQEFKDLFTNKKPEDEDEKPSDDAFIIPDNSDVEYIDWDSDTD